jgi:hypothetical protein
MIITEQWIVDFLEKEFRWLINNYSTKFELYLIISDKKEISYIVLN